MITQAKTIRAAGIREGATAAAIEQAKKDINGLGGKINQLSDNADKRFEKLEARDDEVRETLTRLETGQQFILESLKSIDGQLKTQARGHV